MSIINILANFGKYAISDCPFIYWCLFRGLYINFSAQMQPVDVKINMSISQAYLSGV